MSHEQRPIFIFGASGHAKVVIDIIEKQGIYRIAFLVDDDPGLSGRNLCGYRIIGKKEMLAARVRQGIVAIGNNLDRMRVAEWLGANGCELVSAVHPSAQIGRDVYIGSGSAVMAGAVINSGSSIGDNVILNTRTGIDHDCIIHSGAHIAPGATLCGTVEIGRRTLISAGATIIPNIRVGSDTVVGAGAAVIRDLPANCIAIGAPARIIKSGQEVLKQNTV